MSSKQSALTFEEERSIKKKHNKAITDSAIVLFRCARERRLKTDNIVVAADLASSNGAPTDAIMHEYTSVGSNTTSKIEHIEVATQEIRNGSAVVQVELATGCDRRNVSGYISDDIHAT
jgi:hypothetical protein